MTTPPPRATIAIVDDHEAVRNSAIGFLQSMGYRAIGFASGEELLALDSPQAIDCILLDIRMPGSMNGLAVMRALIQRGLQSRVVVLTGRVDQLLANAAARLGAVEVIEKPCGPLKLVDSVERAFSLRGDRIYARPGNRAC